MYRQKRRQVLPHLVRYGRRFAGLSARARPSLTPPRSRTPSKAIGTCSPPDTRPDRIIVVGDSAGGGLALALGLVAPRPRASRSRKRSSRCRPGPISPRKASRICATSRSTRSSAPERIRSTSGRTPATADLHEPYISPAYGTFAGFPPMMMHVGSFELLESDTLTVARKASEAGVDVSVSIYRGMFHVFQLAFDLVPEAAKAWVEIGDFIQGQFGCTYAFRP
ncbi:MAG: alpha/beta hydrolase [Comamonadaceae bacterium]|nr:alpha/beta hydrolase [Comamonadaceae bacterium]